MIRADEKKSQHSSRTPSLLSPLEQVSCDLCGSSRSSLFLRVPEIVGYFKERDYFDLRKCQECGLIYVSPRPSEKDIGHYYDASTYYAHQSDGREFSHRERDKKWQAKRDGADAGPGVFSDLIKRFRETLRAFNRDCNKWYKSRLAVRYFGYPASQNEVPGSFVAVAEKIVLLIPYLRLRILSKDLKIIPWRGKGRMLDVGCGTGHELLALRERGWSVQGIEFNEKAVFEARQAHGLDIVCGRLKDRLFQSSSFDVITFGNSLEHLHSPRLTLAEAKRVLDPHGLLVIKVPNIDSWSGKFFNARWFQLDVPRHLYHFNPKTLRELLCRAGFRVIRETYDAGATYGIRESWRWKRLYEGKPDFQNRRIYEICFWWMNAIACLFRRGDQLVVFAEPIAK